MPKTAAQAVKPGRGRPAGWSAVYSIVTNPLPEDAYHKKLKARGYEDALLNLARAPRGSVLRFESVKCEASIRRNAEKLGYEVMFAAGPDGELFVQITDTGQDK